MRPALYPFASGEVKGSDMSFVSKGRTALRIALPLLLAAFCLHALWLKFGTEAFGGAAEHILRLPALALLITATSTVLSFWAIGRYDILAHRHFGTRMPDRSAMRAGRVAIALSQTLGFGLFTGALARWRMLPHLPSGDALRLSGFVCLTFMATLGTLAVFALPFAGGPAWPAFAALVLLPIGTALACRYPVLRVRGRSLALPNLRTLSAIALWTAVDVTAAAMALYALMPPEAGSFVAFLPAFLLALGAGLLASSPGGVGPFELALFAALPQVPVPETLAALAGFRLIYYALPALLAMAAMLRPCKDIPAAPRTVPLWQAPHSEIGILRQVAGDALAYEGGASCMLHSAQTVFAFRDPIHGTARPMLSALQAKAAQMGKVSLIYKSGARTATAARAAGWHALRIADEAILKPQTFNLAQPTCRGLRRKLRQAEKSQVSAAQVETPPWDALQRIDKDWQEAHGAARGGTIGRYTQNYVAQQICFVAYLQDAPIAFITFHATAHEWCLDLMRHAPGVPDGTMHTLVVAAIDAARVSGIPRLSLAATTACPDPSRAIMRKLAQFVSARSGGPGLRQFKSAFAPTWEPLYAAAPTRLTLFIGLLDIARSIIDPDPLPAVNSPQQDDEDYEIASSRAA